METIPYGTLGVGSGWAIVAFFILWIMRGKWHPQATIDRMVAEHIATIQRMREDHAREMGDISHDRDEWRAAHRISETARQVASDQVNELLEHSRVTETALRALIPPRGQEAH